MCQLHCTASLDAYNALFYTYVHQMAVAACTAERAASDSTNTPLLLGVESHAMATPLKLTVAFLFALSCYTMQHLTLPAWAVHMKPCTQGHALL